MVKNDSERDLDEVQVLLRERGGQGAPAPDLGLLLLAPAQDADRGLDLLVIHQAVHELLARVHVGLDRLLARQQDLGLDIDEERGHQEELGLAVEVDPLLPSEVFEVLAGDDRDGDVLDVDLLLLDQEEEQVERAFEHFEPDLVAFIPTFRRGRRGHRRGGGHVRRLELARHRRQNPSAARTSSMVFCAAARALALPSSRMSQMRRGSCSKRARRSR
jgi:hypothetical protein